MPRRSRLVSAPRSSRSIGERDESFWQQRYEDINAFERHLERSGTRIVKFFLHVSKEVQKQRFLARLDTPGKEWKFNAADVDERARSGTTTCRPSRTR